MQVKLLDLSKQVEALESGLPGDIQNIIKSKDREIAELVKDLHMRTTATHQPKDTSNTEDSLIAISRKKQQLSASEYDDRLKASVRTMSESVKRYSDLGERKEDEQGKLSQDLQAMERMIDDRNAQITELEGNMERLTAAVDSKDAEIEDLKRVIEKMKREIREKSISCEESLRNKDKEVEYLQGRSSQHSGLISTLQSRVSELAYDSERARMVLQTEISTVSDLSLKLKESSNEAFKAQQAQRQAETSLQIALEANQVLARNLKKAEEDTDTLRKEYEVLERRHEKAIAEVSRTSALQADSMQKILKDMHEKEVKELMELYKGQAASQERETSRLNAEIANLENASKLEISNLQNQLKQSQMKEREVAARLEEANIHLNHSEQQLLLVSQEAESLRKSTLSQGETISTLRAELELVQGKLSNALQSLQTQSEAAANSSRQSLDSARLSERSEIRSFFEMKIMKLRSELITERQEKVLEIETRERIAAELATKTTEKERLEQVISQQKATISDLQAQHLELLKEEQALSVKGKTVHEIKHTTEEYAQLTSELIALRAEIKRKEDDMAAMQASISTKSPTSTQEDSSNIAAIKEKVIEEMSREIERKSEEIRVLSERFAERERSFQASEKLLEEAKARKAKAERDCSTLSQELESLKTRLKEKDSEIQRQREELDKTADSLSARYQQESDSIKQIYEEHFHNDLKDVKELYDSRIAALGQELEALRKENGELAGANSRLNGVKQRLERAQTQSQEELDELQGRVQELSVKLNTVTSQYHDQINMNMSLESALNSLKSSRGKANEDLLASLLAQNSNLSQEVAEKSRVLETLLTERTNLKSELEQAFSELETCKSECLALHKEVYESKRALFRHSLTLSSTISREDLGSVIPCASPEADSALKWIYTPNTEETNAVLRAIVGSKEEAPMTNTNIWKTIETLFQENQRVDRLDRSLNRDLKGLDEVAAAYFNSKYKAKSLAVRQMRALVSGLRELEGLEHAYGVLFSRMLGTALNRPLPPQLTTFLLSAQEVFASISDIPSPSVMEYGQMSSLTGVQRAIRQIFTGHREAGERVASRLKVDSPDLVALLLMKLEAALEAADSSPSSWTDLLQVPEGRGIEYTHFLAILNRANAWITEKELNAIWVTIRNQDTDKVSAEEIDMMEPPQRLRDMMKSKEFLVSKCTFLTGIVEEFEFHIAQDYLRMSILFGAVEWHRAELIGKFQALDSSLSQEKCEEMADESLAAIASKGEFQVNIPAIIVLRHRVNGLASPSFVNKL